MFTTLLVVVGALFVAVLGRAILDPWVSTTDQTTDDQISDEGGVLWSAITLCF